MGEEFSDIIPIDILGDPGTASRVEGIFMGESLQQERESLWALTLTEPVPEAFEFPAFDGGSHWTKTAH